MKTDVEDKNTRKWAGVIKKKFSENIVSSNFCLSDSNIKILSRISTPML
jgi:hypothetical protein